MLKINPKEASPEPIRQLLLYSDSPRFIHITVEDVDELIDGAELVKATVINGNTLEESIQKLLENIEMFEDARKAVLVVRTDDSDELDLTSVAAVTKVTERLPIACEVRWGIAKCSKTAHKAALICATAK